MVGGFLERTGYQVRKASHGIEALQLIRDRVPDLVITDVRMPELNGIELTSRLRGHHRTAGVPILMFSDLGARTMPSPGTRPAPTTTCPSPSSSRSSKPRSSPCCGGRQAPSARPTGAR